MTRNNQITIAGAVIFREKKAKKEFLLVKQSAENGWEFPKVTVRRGESSVRAAIRMTGEQGGMNARVLEEAGRSSGLTTVNGKQVPEKHYYYLMLQKAGGETLGFESSQWLETGKVLRAISIKKEKDVFENAKEVLKTWEKLKQKKTPSD